MKLSPKHIIVIFWMLLLGYGNAFAQTNKKATLQTEYNQILKEIKEIEEMLSKTQSEKEESLVQLQSLNQKISSRQSLISNIQKQVDYIQRNIDEKNEVIKSMKGDLTKLKESYANMVYNSYKNLHTKNQLSFIFSAESFNQALSRFNYLRSYSGYRQNQAALIQKTIADLEDKVKLLEVEKEEKTLLLEEESKQSLVLEQEKNKKNELIVALQQDEKDLKQEAKDKDKAAKKLNNKIEEIIAEEIKLAKEKAAKEQAAKNGTNTTATAPANELGLTPAEKELSSSFVSNKGKLPWPVEKGHVIERFGQNPHPTIPKVYINNNGVDIRAEKDANVRAIFSGSVVSSFYLPTTQNSVIIKHGEYFTVYSNLKNVSVKAGESISTKQVIGTAYTIEGEAYTKVHLEVWQGTVKTNPELWLVK